MDMARRTASQKKPAASQSPDIPADVIARLAPVVLRIFSNEDFHRVDMRSIARSAEMSFATIYRHFRDKEALLFWFIAYWLRELYPAAFAVLETDAGPLERLKRYLLAHLRFYEERPEVGRIIFMTVPLTRWMRDETYRSRESVSRLLAVIAEGQAKKEIRDDVPAILVFDAWYGVFNRAFLMWEYRGRGYPLTREWESLWSILTDGIAAKPARTQRMSRATAAKSSRKTPKARPEGKRAGKAAQPKRAK